MRAEDIGICAWCGVTDHHLVHGSCPRCHAYVVDLGWEESLPPMQACAVSMEDLTSAEPLPPPVRS